MAPRYPKMGLTTRNYDILTRLAVGNGALVYRAMDKVTNRHVALKLLVQDENIDHRFNAEKLLADAGRLKQITGTHVCQLLDAITDDDGPVLVYEFANGVTGAELPAKSKLDAGHVVDVAAQIISALRSGERQKIPHGDVKPSNLIFLELEDKRPFTLVLDWALTAYRSVVADDSLPYLAPERLGGGAASHRADLFSAGAALFFLCTGKTLIAAKTRTEAGAAWQEVLPKIPSVLAELRPDLPVKFVQWLCSLLEFSPEKRPESAVDALVPLAALNPLPPPVPPESFRARPVAPRPNLPIASGIVKLPLQTAKPASAIRKPPPPASKPATSPPTATTPEDSATPAPEKSAASPGIAPVKKSHVVMTLGLFGVFVALIAGVVWFLFFRQTQVRYPGEEFPERPASTSVARTPAPSVGENIRKPITPPPMTSGAEKKPPQNRKPKPTAQPPAPVPETANPESGVERF